MKDAASLVPATFFGKNIGDDVADEGNADLNTSTSTTKTNIYAETEAEEAISCHIEGVYHFARLMFPCYCVTHSSIIYGWFVTSRVSADARNKILQVLLTFATSFPLMHMVDISENGQHVNQNFVHSCNNALAGQVDGLNLPSVSFNIRWFDPFFIAGIVSPLYFLCRGQFTMLNMNGEKGSALWKWHLYSYGWILLFLSVLRFVSISIGINISLTALPPDTMLDSPFFGYRYSTYKMALTLFVISFIARVFLWHVELIVRIAYNKPIMIWDVSSSSSSSTTTTTATTSSSNNKTVPKATACVQSPEKQNQQRKDHFE